MNILAVFACLTGEILIGFSALISNPVNKVDGASRFKIDIGCPQISSGGESGLLAAIQMVEPETRDRMSESVPFRPERVKNTGPKGSLY